jgi:hypothetical protein
MASYVVSVAEVAIREEDGVVDSRVRVAARAESSAAGDRVSEENPSLILSTATVAVVV